MSDSKKFDAPGGTEPLSVDDQAPEAHLGSLEVAMARAFELMQEGKQAEASDLFRQILQVEPRLAEPRLELAHLAASNEEWEEDEAQARSAVQTLRAGGQWTLDLEADVLLAFAINLLGEILVRAIEGSDLIFHDRGQFNTVWNEAAALFREAQGLDPANEDARSNATHHRPIP